MGITSLIIGIFALIVAVIFPYIGWLAVLLGIIGIVLGAIGKAMKAKCAVGGLVCSIIATAMSLAFWIACALCIGAASSY